MNKFKIASHQEIIGYLPQDSVYANANFGKEHFLLCEGDCHIDEPLDLDCADELVLDFPRNGEYGAFCQAIIVTGSVFAHNIYNAEVDGSTGLVVLGNLTAKNIVVGGQEIYVCGSLNVSELYWGDYNHGNLVVQGDINIGVFLETDYGYDFNRFRCQERVNIGYALYDDDEAREEGVLIHVLFRPECILPEQEIYETESYIWSWRCWLREDILFQYLQENRSVLLDKADFRTELLVPAKQETAPNLFADAEISVENLKIFANADHLLLFSEKNANGNLKYSYWDGNIYRRIVLNESEDYRSVYFQQDEDFAVFFECDEGKLTMLFRPLSSEEWHEVTPQTIPEAYEFFVVEWQIFQEQFSQAVFNRTRFNATVTADKFNDILALPLVRDKYSDYQDDESICDWGRYRWRFRQESEECDSRIQITRHRWVDDEDCITFYHFQINVDEAPGIVRLLTQDDNGYEFKAYDVVPYDTVFYSEAIAAFEVLYNNIFRLNQQYVEKLSKYRIY